MVASANRRHPRRAAIVALSAILMVFLLIMVAFAVDTGYQLLTRTQIQSSVDSAVLAGAGALVNGKVDAEAKAFDYLAKNKVGDRTLTATNATLDFGLWDSATRTFTVSNVSNPSALRMTATSTGHPTFFARVMGINSFDSKAKAVATYQPRDICLALDYSLSMCFDSCLFSISKLGRPYVEDNLKLMWQDLGSPQYGLMTLVPLKITNKTTSQLTTLLGLTGVAYPYPGGSWSEYFSAVQNDPTIQAAGYKDCYGYLTWMHYLQLWRGSHAYTPDLWKTHEQPLTAVKDSVTLFLAYLQSNSTDDRVGFSMYTSIDDKAKLETGLTKDFTLVNKLVRERQAGHYVSETNIYDGMRIARLELQNNGRIGAKKMMVLMTDGQANMPTGDPVADKNLALQEAQLAAAAKIPVVTIALGSSADEDLMNQIATITGGVFFSIDGGHSVEEVQIQLEDVFKQVAADRPLKLVQ